MKYLSTLSCVLLCLLTACESSDSGDTKNAGVAKSATAAKKDSASRWSGFSAPTIVRVAKVEPGAVSLYQVSSGNIAAKNTSPVYARVAEAVAAIHVDLGDRVKAGDVIAELYSGRYQAEYDKALSAEKRAKARENEASAELTKLTGDYQRLIGTPEGEEGGSKSFDEGLFSKDEIREAKFAMDKAAIALNIAKQEVVEAIASTALTKIDLDACQIRTPISGVVARRLIDQHQLVARDAEVFMIAQLQDLELTIDIPESVAPRLLARMASGSRPAVLLQTTAHSGKQFLGEVRVVAPVIDPAKGMIQVVVAIIDAAHELAEGVSIEGIASASSIDEDGNDARFSERANALLRQFPPSVRRGLARTLIEAAGKPFMLRPGMWVEASVVTEFKRAKDALVIPATAIIGGSVFIVDDAQESPKKPSVVSAKPDTSAKTTSPTAKSAAPSSRDGAVAKPSTIARLVDISAFIGMQGEGFTEILPNEVLKEGMTVIWRGQEYLKDGGNIEIEKEPNAGGK